jgi:stress-induced morphogen
MIRNTEERTTDPIVTTILDELREYKSEHPVAHIEAYRRNSASVRIRSVDPDFKGKGVIQREDMVWNLLDRLPDEVRGDITMLILETPDEVAKSLSSREFENPTPSRL